MGELLYQVEYPDSHCAFYDFVLYFNHETNPTDESSMLNAPDAPYKSVPIAENGIGLPVEVEIYCRHRLNSDLTIIDCYIKAGFARTRSVKNKKLAELFDKRDAVAKRIGELRHMMYHRMELTAERIEEEYMALAFTKMDDIIDWGINQTEIGEDGKGEKVYLDQPYITPRNSKDINPGALAAIQEISMGPNGMKIKLHDKFKALDAIARRFEEFQKRSALEISADQLPPEVPLTAEEIELIEQHFEEDY